MDDLIQGEKIFSVDFRHIERCFKAMGVRGESIEGMRDLLNEDARQASIAMNDFIDDKVRSKYRDTLRSHMHKVITSLVSLGIAEFKLAAKDIKQEDLTEGKRSRGEHARAISLAVKDANPGLTTDQLRPLIDDARAKSKPRLDAIKKSTLYAHLGARASKKMT